MKALPVDDLRALELHRDAVARAMPAYDERVIAFVRVSESRCQIAYAGSKSHRVVVLEVDPVGYWRISHEIVAGTVASIRNNDMMSLNVEPFHFVRSQLEEPVTVKL